AQVARGRRYALGYNAVDDTTRRRKPTTRTTPEIDILTPRKRQTASATAREDRRNMSILAWMIRRHLDNVSRFTPHFRIAGDTDEIRAVNAAVSKLLRWHARPRQFDALGRHGRDEWLRMFEGCKVIAGDCGGLKVQGGRLQGIEGDRISKPSAASSELPKEYKDRVTGEGLVIGAGGMVEGYCVCSRSMGGSMEYERVVPSADMIFDAYWPERFDSFRGVSPLLTALNEAADVREVWEWLVLKAKATGLFGLAFTRTGPDDMFPSQGDPATTPPSTEGNAYTAQVNTAMKSRGLINLDLDPGDKVEEIESKTPNPTVVSFTRELIRSILLALDIPFTFYDSLTASFSARIADRNEYEESCEWKRDKNTGVLDEIYGGWLLPIWAEADLFGYGKALKAAKLSNEEAAASLRWVPAGRPWLDRSNEMSGHILALAAGVTSTPRICASYGDDAYEIAAEQKEFLEKSGIPLLYAQGGQFSVQSLMGQVEPAEDAPPGQPAGEQTQQ
ncbi:MAG: phage portal protein, partial [Verrucomicrobiota bacterium]